MKIMTVKRAFYLGSIALAFAAGANISRLQPQAQAATEMTPMVIHVPDLSGDKLGLASGTGLRSKGIVVQDGMTLSVQAGPVPKHLHVNANEIQYYLEGSGTIWLGDKEVHVGPGDLVVIPKGTAHGGTKPDAGSPQFKAIAIKTPPQAPDDVKPLN